MKRTIASLALLKTSWDKYHHDYIEGFIPFLVAIIQKKNIKQIDLDVIHDICAGFEDEFGLKIPYHPMVTIIDRCRKRGVLQKKNHKYVVQLSGLEKYNFLPTVINQEQKYNKVIAEMIKYAQDEYKFALSQDEAEAALVAYLKSHDLDVLFASREKTVLPPADSSKQSNYILNSFLANVYKCDPELFAYVVDVAIGHVVANTILYRDLSKLSGKLRKTKIYLDTKVVFNLLGIYGARLKEAYAELLSDIRSLGAELYLFSHTYDEAKLILENALAWVDSEYYDRSKASDVLNYFIDEGFSSSDAQKFILNVDSLIESFEIEVVDTVDPNALQEFQVNEEDLMNVLFDVYEIDVRYITPEKKQTYIRDISSISSVLKLRKGVKPSSINKVSNVFVTTNSRLAYAGKLFEDGLKDNGFYIPACITDVFLGTLIWLHKPAKAEEMSAKRIIAESYAALQPNYQLIDRLITEAKKLREEEKITGGEFAILQADRVARELLAKKTLGDPDNFSPKTLQEIIEEVKERERLDEQEKRIESERSHKKVEAELYGERREKEELLSRIRGNAISTAKRKLKIIDILFVFVVIGSVCLSAYTGLKTDVSIIWLSTYIIISVIFMLLSAIWGWNYMSWRSLLQKKFEDGYIEKF